MHAEDLVVPYGATDLPTCPRITHVIKMDSNEIKKLQLAGFYRIWFLIMAQVAKKCQKLKRQLTKYRVFTLVMRLLS